MNEFFSTVLRCWADGKCRLVDFLSYFIFFFIFPFFHWIFSILFFLHYKFVLYSWSVDVFVFQLQLLLQRIVVVLVDYNKINLFFKEKLENIKKMEGKKKVKKRKQNLHAWKTYAKCEWCLKLLPYMTLHVKRVDLSVDEGITKKIYKMSRMSRNTRHKDDMLTFIPKWEGNERLESLINKPRWSLKNLNDSPFTSPLTTFMFENSE
jgi:hypothetical protein